MWEFINKNNVIWKPPFCDFVRQKFIYLIFADIFFICNNKQYWSFIPFWMPYANNTCFGDMLMSNSCILKID